jgi:hypothetical protein
MSFRKNSGTGLPGDQPGSFQVGAGRKPTAAGGPPIHARTCLIANDAVILILKDHAHLFSHNQAITALIKTELGGFGLSGSDGVIFEKPRQGVHEVQ